MCEIYSCEKLVQTGLAVWLYSSFIIAKLKKKKNHVICTIYCNDSTLPHCQTKIFNSSSVVEY